MTAKSTYAQYLISHPTHRCVAFFQTMFLCNVNFADVRNYLTRDASHLGFEFFIATKFIRTPQGGMMYFASFDSDPTLSRCRGIEIDGFITDELHVKDRIKVNGIMRSRVRHRSKQCTSLIG